MTVQFCVLPEIRLLSTVARGADTFSPPWALGTAMVPVTSVPDVVISDHDVGADDRRRQRAER